jgi:cytochrome c553
MNSIFEAMRKQHWPVSGVAVRLKLLFGWLAIVATVASGANAMAQQSKVEDTIAQRAIACAACHGKEGRATNEGFFPRIAGKPAGYLYNQLVNFREGRRQYPLMTYLVAHMSDDYLKEMAEYFSSLRPPYAASRTANVSHATLERGRVLVVSGDASRNIPACIACHGQKLTGVLPAIPSLVGLPRDYLNSQFGAWKTGSRRTAAPDCMAQISKQLSPEDIGAISAWLASQPIPADMNPAATLSAKLPVPCGSALQ